MFKCLHDSSCKLVIRIPVKSSIIYKGQSKAQAKTTMNVSTSFLAQTYIPRNDNKHLLPQYTPMPHIENKDLIQLCMTDNIYLFMMNNLYQLNILMVLMLLSMNKLTSQ